MVNKKYISSLTGLRTVAAHLVLFHHLIYDEVIQLPLAHLYVGFIIFFVLSGFLITYHNYAPIRNSVFCARDYFLKRFARIYPTYLLVLIMSLVMRSEFPADWGYWFMNLTLLKGWSFKYMYAGVGQAWTLTLEETFYALAPLLFFALSKWRTPLWIFCLVSLGLGVAHFWLGRVFSGNPHFPQDLYSATQLSFFFMFLPFAFGIFSAMIVIGARPRMRDLVSQIPNLTYISLFGFLVSMAFLEWAKPFESPFHLFNIWQPISILFLIPFTMTFFFVGLTSENTRLAAVLGSKPFQVLGKSSYALYLIHSGPLAIWMMTQLDQWIPELTPPLFILIMNLIAIMLYYLFEQPIANRIRSRLRQT